MQRLDECRGKAAAIDRAAEIARVDLALIDALPDQEHADLEIGNHHRAALLEDRGGIERMVVMAMRQKHVRDALGRAFPALAPGRVARQEGVDQDFRGPALDAERGMAVPGDFHGAVLRLDLCSGKE